MIGDPEADAWPNSGRPWRMRGVWGPARSCLAHETIVRMMTKESGRDEAALMDCSPDSARCPRDRQEGRRQAGQDAPG